MVTVPPLFRSLIDDAAVFPPGDLPLKLAVPAHHDHRRAWYAGLVGPLLCPSSALGTLEELVRDDRPLDVAVVVDTGTAGVLEAVDVVAQTEHLTLRGVEVPLRGETLAENARRTVTALDTALGGPDDDEPGYVEVPRAPGWQAALDVIADSGYRAKLRTGGADPSAYPSTAELAAFVIGCLDRGIAFKLTAGLHHAVRHTTTSGQVEHGFLNVINAVAAALDGGGQDVVAATLGVADADVVAAAVRSLAPERAAAVRRWFTSYGACSITEPLADVVGLGLVTEPDDTAR